MSGGPSHRDSVVCATDLGDQPRAVGQPVDEFLASARVVVLDVLRGAAPGTRRLLLGTAEGADASRVIAVADQPASGSAIDAEGRLLGDLAARLSAETLLTVPDMFGPVDVGGRRALVVTAVPGMVPERRRRPVVPVREMLDAVRAWLVRLWHETAGPSGPIGLGSDAADTLLARYVGSPQLAPTLGAVHHARQRLGDFEVIRTVTHGCLCPRHVNVADRTVVGVDDWGLGSASAEPLRDLGGFAVRCAGARLPELLAGRTAYAHLLRDFVISGLTPLGLPAACWRDVLLLTHLEHAVGGLERGHLEDMDLLATTVRTLPRQRRYEEKRST